MKWKLLFCIGCIVLSSIILFCNVLIKLNIINYNGRLKLEIKEDKGLPIGWIIMLIVSIVIIITSIVFIKVLQKNSYTLKNLSWVFLGIIWADRSVNHIITDRIYFQVREKGVFINKNFYRWKELKNYKWLESDILQFELRRPYNKMDKYIEIKIDGEHKQVVDLQLNRYSRKIEYEK